MALGGLLPTLRLSIRMTRKTLSGAGPIKLFTLPVITYCCVKLVRLALFTILDLFSFFNVSQTPYTSKQPKLLMWFDRYISEISDLGYSVYHWKTHQLITALALFNYIKNCNELAPIKVTKRRGKVAKVSFVFERKKNIFCQFQHKHVESMAKEYNQGPML